MSNRVAKPSLIFVTDPGRFEKLPMSLDELQLSIARGELNPDTALIWHEGLESWTIVRNYEELLPPSPPPIPPGGTTRNATHGGQRVEGADEAPYAEIGDATLGVPMAVRPPVTRNGGVPNGFRAFASPFARIASSLVDNLILSVVFFIFGFFFQAIFDPGEDGLAFLNIACFLGTALYFAVLESSYEQATYAQRFLRVAIVDMDGNRISFARALVRFFLNFLLIILTLGLGSLTYFFTERKQCLWDILSSTMVVRTDWKIRPSGSGDTPNSP